ncbi:MAG: hydroxymethylbilane synthase [Solirubrobacterales bacterium]
MLKIRAGSRGSKLALWQTDLVIEKLSQLHPGVCFETVMIKTKGDKLLDVALSRIGDKGLFTKEIESELLAGHIDLAVHSMKDLPTEVPDGLEIGAILTREQPQDVLIAANGASLAELPHGARIGTSSLRRRAQLAAVRPDLRIVDLRGNIDTRIRRLTEEGLDAIILAFAGVARLGYEDRVTEMLPFLPAVGQGAIGIEIRKDDPTVKPLVQTINHDETRTAIAAERSFMAVLEGGCQIPIGALGTVKGDQLEVEGLVADLDGKRILRDRMTGPAADPVGLGRKLAERLLDQGAGDILREIRSQESNR